MSSGNHLFDMLSEYEQHKWLQTSAELSGEAETEFQPLKESVDKKKTLIKGKGPFGSEEEHVPVDVMDLFKRLSVLRHYVPKHLQSVREA